MLIRWQKTIVDQRGNVQPGAVLTVRRMADQAIVPVFRDADGADAYPTGAVTADENGYAYFYTSPGLYRITSSQPAIDWPDVSIAATFVTLGGGPFSTVQEGLDATEDGDFFSVAPSTQVGALFDLYRNDAGAASLIGSFPSMESIERALARSSEALSEARTSRVTWALPNRKFDLSDPVRTVCKANREIVSYQEPKTGRMRMRYASSDRLTLYPYRSFYDDFLLPTVDAAGRVISDLSVGLSGSWVGAAPLYVTYDGTANVLRCAWRHGASQMWRTTYQRNGFNDLWNWRQDDIAPLGDPAEAAWATIRSSSSDAFPPMIVYAQFDGNPDYPQRYTGGNHGSNGDASGLQTARMISLELSVDGRVLVEGESFAGYAANVRMRWTNELMGSNTIEGPPELGVFPRYILRQSFDFTIRPGDVSGYAAIRALEPIEVHTENSLQVFAQTYDTLHFYDGQQQGRMNIADATSATNSGPAGTWKSWANILAGPYGYHGVWGDRTYGAGDGKYIHGSVGFYRYGGSGKFYSPLVGGGGVREPFNTGEGYDWHAGYIYAPLVDGMDSAFTFTRRRKPYLGYAFTATGSGSVALPDYLAGAEVADVGVDGVFGVPLSATGYDAEFKAIEV